MIEWNGLSDEEKAELVATKVMGWELTHDTSVPADGFRDSSWSTEMPKRYRQWSGNARIRPTYGEWRPTENIEQAWEVLEHVADRDLNEHAAALGLARVVLNKYPTGEWSCRITRDMAAVARDSNVCEAICHAAVLAVGEMTHEKTDQETA